MHVRQGVRCLEKAVLTWLARSALTGTPWRYVEAELHARLPSPTLRKSLSIWALFTTCEDKVEGVRQGKSASEKVRRLEKYADRLLPPSAVCARDKR